MATKVKKGNNTIYWIIGGLVVVAGGIGIYFLLRNRNKQKENKNTAETNNKNTEVNTNNTSTINTSTSNTASSNTASSSTPTNSTLTSSTPTSSKPTSNLTLSNYKLDTTAKIKAFQDWMDAQGKGWIYKNGKWVLLNKGAGYGNFGTNTKRVWDIFGKDYIKSLN
jgi:cytoskeletal protein RodZ